MVSARDFIPDTATPCVQRPQQPHVFSAKPLENPGERSFTGHRASSWCGREEKKLCPRRCNRSSAQLSLFPEVSRLTLPSLIPYLQVTPLLSQRLESADLIFMLCLHTLLITLGINFLPYLGCAWYMKVSDLPSASLLLPSFVVAAAVTSTFFFQ